MKYKPTIGMEIHVELRTNSKMFCGCPADHFGKEPNTQTCPVCLGLPGALPVPNQKAIDWTVLIGLALNCRINPDSKFDRKHYFYPDLPKGYQISQYDEPLCTGGIVKTSQGDVHLTRIHLEEDTGKLQHKTIDGKKVTLVDFNRSSVPLVEIVSDPEIKSAAQAKEYAQAIRQIISFLGVSDADMEKGSMRLEANISLGLDLGYKVEVKNINSFRFLEKAISYELKRQQELLDEGVTPKQETRGFNENRGYTVPQRSKEDAADYRYFPDPDIPPIHLSSESIKKLRQSIPLMPDDYSGLFTKTYQLRPDYGAALSQFPKLAQKTLDTLKIGAAKGVPSAAIANYLINKKAHAINQTPEDIITILSSQQNRTAVDNNELESIIAKVIKENSDIVTKYHHGKTSVIGALIGAVMQQTQKAADPQEVRRLILSKLN